MAADLVTPAVQRDHVLGISSASTSLAQLTMREPVGSALDLGTGCGAMLFHGNTTINSYDSEDPGAPRH